MEKIEKQENREAGKKILGMKELYELLPFGKTKIKQMAVSGSFPFLIKIGRHYVFFEEDLYVWLKNNRGNQIHY